MKLKKDNKLTLFLKNDGSAFIEIVNEWRQLFGNFNWYSFTFFQIYFENDIMCPGYEFIFIILGLGFRIRWNRSWEGTEVQESIDEIEKIEQNKLLTENQLSQIRNAYSILANIIKSNE